jgi:glycosyltransferase involved in cell wall biosynthesis
MIFDVGIDGYNLALPNGTGVATYGYVLANMLHEGGHRVTGLFGVDPGRDPALREVLFYDRLGQLPPTPALRARRKRRIARKALIPFARAEAIALPRPGRVDIRNLAERLPHFDRLATSPDLFDLAHRHFRLYRRFLPVHLPDRPAIMHWTYPVPITLVGAANIYTIHDLVPLRLPYTTLDAKIGYRRLLAACISRAAHICTVSETSRYEIIAEFGCDPDHLTNTYQASPLPTPQTRPDEDAMVVERTFGLTHRNYFLHLGAIEPKKNIGRMIEAFLASGVEAPLVLTGSRGWRSDAELALLPGDDEVDTRHGRSMAERVRRLDHVSRPLLARLIRGARALLFPSIAEGFGLPVLEAMQLGTPVLTSRMGAVAEIAGDAAVLVDPYDVADIGRGILRLDGDEALRRRLEGEGPVAAKRFSPVRYRDRIERLYGAVVERIG